MALFLLLTIILLRIPLVQTQLGKIATSQLNKSYDTDILVKKVDLSFLGSVKLKDIRVDDHKKDSLIYIKSLQTSIFSYRNIVDNRLELGDVTMEDVIVNMVTHPGDSTDNLAIFVEKFDDGKERDPNTPSFLMTSPNLTLKNVNFILYDKNVQQEPIVYYKGVDGLVQNFKVEGPEVSANIRGLSFAENHQIEVESLSSDFKYTKSQMTFLNTELKTSHSLVNADIIFNYTIEELADFNNKVQIEADFKKSSISLIDLNRFYDELGKNDKINFTTRLRGTLNDFTLKDLRLVSNRNSIIDGDLHFKNVLNKEGDFSLDARIYELSSTHTNLKELLPNILGKTLPSILDKFGRFSLAGQSYITDDLVNANIVINSALGRSITDLELTNIDDIDNARYKGQVEFVDLDFGKIVNDSLIGKLSLVADVDGKGFTLEKLDTRIKGVVSKHQYKGYTYSNIDVNGVFKNQLFDGQLVTNDEHLKMNFNGLADLSSADYKFDFNADVAYSDFNKLNLFTDHEKAVLKGKIAIKITGNSLDNSFGTIDIKDASYTNHIDEFYFKDFNINSSFRDTIRTISVNSTDIVNGTLKGRFKFEELPKLAKNSLGSVYTNFEPDRVSTGQFLDFNFKIYNKIIEVFYPQVNVGPNTSIRGKINADQNKFELLVKSPKVEAYDNIIEQIRLQIDNKNPLYNTLLSMGKVNTKYYKMADLNLVNVTLNDTLFFRTDFVGGDRLQEKFDLSFYHTLNENNQSVIGIKPSNIKFKNNDWRINPTDNNQNKVVFDEQLQTFAFDRITAVSGDQEIDLLGVIAGDANKDISLNLKDVKLEGITPKIDSLSLKGLVNGRLNYRAINGRVLPIAQVIVDDFYVNDYNQGSLVIDAQGGSSLKKYVFNASLENEVVESIFAKGEVDFEPSEPTIFANFSLDKFDIKAFSPLGEDVLDNIRGEISGNGIVTGLLKNPDIDGELVLEKGGLAFPYLNVDYDFIGRSTINLSKQTFQFLPTTLLDVVHDTEATLSGLIRHNEFKRWYLDLNIATDNLLVLNTQESEDIPYYGTGFIQGTADIIGYTDQLVIDVEGKTMPGSEFIVPLNDVSTIGDSKLVRFISRTEEGVDENVVEEVVFDAVKGLTLNFFLEATDDALAEIVIDRNTGSILRGRGFGNFDITINTNGKFEVIGTYVVSEGIYEFRNIVNKDFVVQPGGSVSWEGNPFDAYLNNITAVYRTQANPSVLLDNVNTSRELDVDLIAKISGQLLNSDIEFDLDIPNSSSAVNSELQFKLSDQNRKMTQFFSLLVSGAFTNIDEGGIGIDAGVAGTSLLSEKISSVLSNLLQSRGDKFNVGVSYAIGNRNNLNEALNTDDQLGITASGRLGKRIIWNGRVGVPVGGNTQSRVVGEVELELPLNKAETFRLKGYNRQNEVEFAVADEEGYTQGIGLSYRVDFDSGKELKEKIFGPSKKAARKKKKDSAKVRKSLVNFVKAKRDSTAVKKKSSQ